MGGSDPQPPQFITPPPPQVTQLPPPNIQDNAADLFGAQLEFNPQLTQQAAELQQQFGPILAQLMTDIQTQQAPQLAQSQFDIQAEFGPQQRQLFEQLFPTQVAGQEELASQALQRLQSPQQLTPEQLAAQSAVRDRAQERAQRGIRTQANVGGTLFGGNREQREQDTLVDLANQFSLQDIGLQQQNRAQTLQELIASSQVAFPQVQQPGVGAPGAAQFGQSVTPDPNALLQALLGNQIVQQPIYQPGNAGTPGFFQSFSRGVGGQGSTF